MKSSAYIRFLNYLDSLDRINLGKLLDPIEEQLLNHISLATLQGKTVFVRDLISLDKLGSPATLHGRIKNLVAMDYVRLKEDKSDGRKRLVMPTVKALKHYEQLSSYLEKANANNSAA
jgi:hypothetical protein